MLAACCYLHGGAASADDDRLQVHGFFSQAAAHTDKNNVGVRYDHNSSWALSAEYHDVDGTAWLPRLDNPAAQMQQRWQMFLLQAAYRF
jgi:hypothetical protein